jgi:hypothetical protein
MGCIKPTLCVIKVIRFSKRASEALRQWEVSFLVIAYLYEAQGGPVVKAKYKQPAGGPVVKAKFTQPAGGPVVKAKFTQPAGLGDVQSRFPPCALSLSYRSHKKNDLSV